MDEGDKPGKSRVARRRKPKLHPIVKWLRAVGIASLLFGLGGLVLADWFWPGVACICLGFIALAIDVWFEPDFHGRWKWQLSAWAIILMALVGFSWKIVFVDAPMPVFALVTDGEYDAGTVISGISWRPEFTELNVDITNPTDRVYEDLDIVIRPTDSIAAIAQSTSFDGVTFEDADDTAVRLMDKNFDLGTSKAIPIVLLATDVGYRMRCPRLPAHSTLKITIALADILWTPHPQPNVPIQQIVRDPNYVVRFKGDDFSTYWFGHKDGAVYATRPTSTEWLKIKGDYLVAHKKRHISQKVMIGGKVTVKPPS